MPFARMAIPLRYIATGEDSVYYNINLSSTFPDERHKT
jgi:hypothetical protein